MMYKSFFLYVALKLNISIILNIKSNYKRLFNEKNSTYNSKSK